jgi:pimeloyl-ACP methyl ester carboxylesterase
MEIQRRDVSCSLAVAGRQVRVAGQLTWSGDLARRTIQVLVPGYTYDRTYWDFPYRPDVYSYVRAAVDAGYAPLALDRLGTGASSRPPARLLTLDNHVAGLDAIVTALRAGTFADTSASRIITVGHSLGSAVVSAHAVSAGRAGRCSGPDALVLTGFSHFVLPGTLLFYAAGWWRPVRSVDGNWPPRRYRTTIPGSRRLLFYAPGAVDRDVLLADERLKSTTAHYQEARGRMVIEALRTRALRQPVLVVTGSRDTIVCGLKTWMRVERRFFDPSTDATLLTVRGAGHCLNTSPSSRQTFDRILQWCDSRVGCEV